YTGAMLFDLHCHTTASDGELSPGELLARAASQGVSHLAITDHDSVAAYGAIADPGGLTLIPGVEFSTTWGRLGVHVLGLNIDPHSPAIREGVMHQGNARRERAARIAERLEKYGLKDALAGACRIAGSDTPGRPHFARHMVASGFVRHEREAFKKYLGAGKPGDIRQHWASPEQVIAWIRGAGGTAVLAHPAKYGLTRNRLIALAETFKAWGGEGLEVVSGVQVPAVTRDLAALCQRLDLCATWGSDFHRPGQPWAELGRYSTPPEGVRPAWERW
ncbi:MAG: PHP domain-containing protein, partial [Porticoccaceae bacterium]|nr:PHP domain-containing protein [Porticoccaceae bacterium]